LFGSIFFALIACAAIGVHVVTNIAETYGVASQLVFMLKALEYIAFFLDALTYVGFLGAVSWKFMVRLIEEVRR